MNVAAMWWKIAIAAAGMPVLFVVAAVPATSQARNTLGQAPSHDALSAAPDIVEVEGQPLAANVLRVLDAMRYLGSPLAPANEAALKKAAEARDSARLQ